MRRGFTLIELIFVIVIIGLLSAIAIPKFLNLKQNAEASAVINTTVNAAQQAAEVSVNYLDLENNSSFTLGDIVKIKGKNWSYDDTATDNNGTYEYNATNGTAASVTLYLDNRTVNYKIDCTKFDATTQAKCENILGDTSVDINITF